MADSAVQCPEWSLIKLIAVMTDRESTAAAKDFALSHPLDPDRLVGLAARHSLGPALAHFQQELKLASLVPVGSRRLLRDSWDRNRQRTAAFVEEADRICAALRDSGIVVAVTKGVIAQETIYGGNGVRVFNDIDLMVGPDTCDAVRDRLRDIGYRVGTAYDHANGQLIPIPRPELLNYRLSPDHLPHLARLTSGSPVSHFVLDVALDFLWHNAPWNIPVDPALARRVQCPTGQPGVSLPALDPVYDFLFLCLHVFREGWRTANLARKDVRLAQFADIRRHWLSTSRGSESQIAQAIHDHELQGPVAWAVGHTDTLFGSTMAGELGLDPYLFAGWLNSACRTPGEYLYWAGDMDDRLGSKPRHALVPHPESDIIRTCFPDRVW